MPEPSETIDAQLRALLQPYVRSWGPVEWSGLRETGPRPPDRRIGEMLLALALIEGDSQVMRRKLAATHADRHQALLEFIAVWLAEEGEHSRALTFMAGLFGVDSIAFERRRLSRDLRAFITWPSLCLARFAPGLSATYCALGAMQELVALTTYNHLAAVIGDAECAEVLRRIARQEARHMRFYRCAAEVFLRGSRAAQVSTSVLIRRLWRPPGMDLLGPKRYADFFRPLLAQREYVSGLLAVDRIASGLPGLGEITVMSDYLRRNDFLRDVGPPSRLRVVT